MSDMTRERAKPGAAWLMLAIVVAVVLYPVLFGPVVWLTSRGYIHRKVVEWAYDPILPKALDGPQPVRAAIEWWGSLGIPRERATSFNFVEPDGTTLWVAFCGPVTTASGFRMTIRSFPPDAETAR